MKENFITNISEEEIILAPPTELFEEAREIAQNTTADKNTPLLFNTTQTKRTSS